MRKHIAHYDYDTIPCYLEIRSDERKAILTHTLAGDDLSEPNKSTVIVLKDKDQVQWLYHQLWHILEKDR